MLKNLLKIFGKELYNPIKCKKWNNTIKNHNIINNFNFLNVINNNEMKFVQDKRKREKKGSCSLIK
jgi:Fe-S cluster biosynthesis and repair protein YggX